MQLTERQKRHLRGLGHRLKPVVMIGDAGLTDGVLKEIISTISHHELIKVKVRVGDRDARDALIDELCSKSGASLVARIGNVALVYRRNDENPGISLQTQT